MARLIKEDEIEAIEESDIVSVEEPTVEEEYAPKTSIPEAFLRSAAQGLTSEMADEATARIESVLTGKPYEQALEESRAEYKLAEEEYPTTSLVGGVGGGVAQALGLTALTGGVGAPAAAASSVSRLAKLGQLAKSTILPATTSSPLKNIQNAAKAGAVMGGLAGYGASEKEGLEALPEAATSALSGAALSGVFGGAAEGLGAAGKAISKGIDEGKYPEVFKRIRSSYRLGKEGKEFLSEKGARLPEEQILEVGEKTVIPAIKQSLDEAREVRNFLYQNADVKIDLEDVLKNLEKNLPGGIDSENVIKDLRSHIAKITKSNVSTILNQMALAGGTPYRSKGLSNLSITDAVDVEDFLRSIGNKKDLTQPIKKAIFNTTDSIDSMIKNAIPEDKAAEILNKSSDYLNKYSKILSSFENKEITNPIQILNKKMSSALNAFEILGDINPAGKSEAERIKDVEKLFKNIVNQGKDTSGGFLSGKRFEAAINALSSDKELPDAIKKEVEPLIEQLATKRWLRGEGFGEAKDSAFIKKTVGEIGKLGAEGVNLVTAALTAAKTGAKSPFPLVPTTPILRPTSYVLRGVKSTLDDQIAKNPARNKTKQMFSDMINNALEQQDETRRAAMLNTLMQYGAFRDIVKDILPDNGEE